MIYLRGGGGGIVGGRVSERGERGGGGGFEGGRGGCGGYILCLCTEYKEKLAIFGVIAQSRGDTLTLILTELTLLRFCRIAQPQQR